MYTICGMALDSYCEVNNVDAAWIYISELYRIQAVGGWMYDTVTEELNRVRCAINARADWHA